MLTGPGARCPLLERLRYQASCRPTWTSSSRRAPRRITAVTDHDTKGAHTQASFEALMASAQGLVARQYQLYNDLARPWRPRDCASSPHGQRTAEQRRWVQGVLPA